MASTYTIKIANVCAGGEHIALTAYKDGVAEGTFHVTRSEAIENDLTWKDVVAFLCKKAIKNTNANTAAKQKTAIEAIQVIL